MKYFLTILICTCSLSALAQDNTYEQRIAVGYLGNFGIQPGLRVSTSLSLSTTQATHDWIVSPQVAFFTNPGDDRNFIFGGELGRLKSKAAKHRYRIWGLGLNYLAQSKVRSFSVNLGNGQTSDRNYIHNGFLLPTLSFEHGWATDKPKSWYLKYTLGQRVLGSEDTSFMLFVEFGLKLKWKKSPTTTDQ